MRIGHGYDVHKFGGDGPIILGTVAIDFSKGLIAHSDGDVLLHALCDAILGALGKGDIGKWFPDTDNQWLGVDSSLLLAKVVSMMVDEQWIIGNIDITIIAQKPKMSPHLEVMKDKISKVIGCNIDQINIKATTTEGLGFTGRKEGIAVHSVVLLRSKHDQKLSTNN